jgi:ERCC4-related helicase
VRTDGCHRISPLIEQEWIDLDGAASHLLTNCKMSDEYDLNLLVDVVKRSLDVLRHKSIMIFVESRKSVDKICEILQKAEIKNLPYYQDTGMQGR